MHYDDFLNAEALKRYAAALNARAVALGLAGRVDADLLRGLILESAGRCAWCDAGVVRADFEIDHITPLSRGGVNTLDNLALTCPECNRRKSGKSPATFAQECVAAGGAQTALIARVLAAHGIDAPPRQRSLFGDDD
jgi:hypothetical protein